MGDERNLPGSRTILETFNRHQVQYVHIGGAAAESLGWRGLSDDVDLTPATTQQNLQRVADAVKELDCGFRVDAVRYPMGFHQPGGIDARTFRNQVSVALTSAEHGDLDIALRPDGTAGFGNLVRNAATRRVAGTSIAVPIAARADIIRSKQAADREKDRDVLPAMRLDFELSERTELAIRNRELGSR
jgi:hypothetical protein